MALHCSAIHPHHTPRTTNPNTPANPQRQGTKTIPFSSNAHHLFDQIPLSDTFTWNTLIRSQTSEGHPHHAILTYHQMLLRGARPDKHTIPRLLAASRLSNSFFDGKQIHCHALKLGFASDDYVITALMEMYGWFTGSSDALKFDSVALVTALRACMQLKSVHEGRKVHEIARKSELEFDVLVGNLILKMYVECSGIEEARSFFDQMPTKDAASWTTVINGYVQCGGFNEGLKIFRQMCLDGTRPDSFSVSAVLPACARMAAQKHGKEIHAHTIRNHYGMNSTVQNALMDMYVKSGSVELASEIFGRMEEKDAISWTIMIFGYSLHGQGDLGVALFHEMVKQNNESIDNMTYTAVLHACSSACIIDEGKVLFDQISRPQVEHFALMVGLLSHAGYFDEAQKFIEKHQIGSRTEIQRALLNGCKIHDNMKLGKRIAEQLIELEPLNAENYVLLSNVYAAIGKREIAKELRETIHDMGLKPKMAYSWIELRSKVHVFGVGDVSHPRSQAIHRKLGYLKNKMKKEGYIPDNDFSLHDVDQERGCIVDDHSEMIAIAFGLISTQKSITLRVTKNLPVCRNCHASAKMISKIVHREILLKDPQRFHHFKNGSCSCNDIW
ncbi:pentatricopeptide repeat-containing protein At4g33170-like [Dioscorea cayenensis subsp. rotundata]|uniref:Pentatricopeptide repeat-containing protein At4g33170-like n=1 Tax=Dioscorea cayennensis subsp. rotundata TaxID=55577 RepID=A0AB40CFW5_DIOCR|nr:pentatricopeptide repeat-containing protein At4g33170-like [Dioscorea cayenensis subsp. rotundata]